MKVNGLAVSAFTVLFLVGCTTNYDKPSADFDIKMRRGANRSYELGFEDGCACGRRAAGNTGFKYQKDISEFSTSLDYRMGWQDGYNMCLTREVEILNQKHVAEQPYYEQSPEINEIWDELKK